MVDLGGILGSSSDTKSIKTCIQEHLFFQHRIFWIFFDFDSILGGRDVPAWSLHSPYKSLETLIFRMLGRIAAQESYQGRF